jgi:hypothetical protein
MEMKYLRDGAKLLITTMAKFMFLEEGVLKTFKILSLLIRKLAR